MKRLRYLLMSLAVLSVLWLAASRATAEDALETALALVDSQTVVLIQMDATQMKLGNPMLELFPDLLRAVVQGGPTTAQDAGLRSLMMGLTLDQRHPLRFCVIEISDSPNEELLGQILDKSFVGRGDVQNVEVEKRETVYVAKNPQQVKIPTSEVHRELFAKAIAASADFPIIMAIAPSPEQRRVLAEVMPANDRTANSALRTLGQDTRWASLGFDVDDAQRSQFLVQCSAADSTERVAQALNRILRDEKLTSLFRLPPVPEGELKFDVQGDQLALEPGMLRDSLAANFAQAAKSAVEALDRQDAMRQMKQIMLAVHNYYSANGYTSEIPLAIRDEQGRPLLSWRVLLLPYLEGSDLSHKFRLDEPWDSEHNRALIKEMPAVFAMPRSEAAQEGRTVFQFVTGPETVAPEGNILAIREIVDGTSYTIGLVEVAEELAVEWTRPDDWEVNLDEPHQGTGDHLSDVFLAGMMDGSVQALSKTLNPELLRKLLTATGREPIDYSEVERN